MTTANQVLNEPKEGMLDIGKHCTICHQIDFLPYTCSKCANIYCQNHKSQYVAHNCGKVDQVKVDVSHLPSSQSVFPDLSELRKQNPVGPKVISKIGSDAAKSSSNSWSPESTLGKLISGLKAKMGSSGSKKPIPKGVQMAQRNHLIRIAKGDSQIPKSDRIYIWCSTVLESNSGENAKEGFFVSRQWSLGRTLDSLAQLKRVPNLNNVVNDQQERLFLLNEQMEKFTLSNKAGTSLKTGDLVYLVKGSP